MNQKQYLPQVSTISRVSPPLGCVELRVQLSSTINEM
jgi:hypothetical protein